MGSFEYPPERSLETLLDVRDPALLVVEIEHVQGEYLAIRRLPGPDGSGRRRDDGGEGGKAMRVAQVERDVEKSRPDLTIPHQTEHDALDRDVRFHDLDHHDQRQRCREVEAPQGGAHRT